MSKPQETSQDTLDAIKKVAMDYAEGWFTGDAVRMERALHENLVKRTIVRTKDPAVWTTGRIADKVSMVRWTDEGEGRDTPGDRVYEVEVQDVFREIASVRCLSLAYVDYLQLAHFGNEGWKIVNVLWQFREGEEVEGAS